MFSIVQTLCKEEAQLNIHLAGMFVNVKKWSDCWSMELELDWGFHWWTLLSGFVCWSLTIHTHGSEVCLTYSHWWDLCLCPNCYYYCCCKLIHWNPFLLDSISFHSIFLTSCWFNLSFLNFSDCEVYPKVLWVVWLRVLMFLVGIHFDRGQHGRFVYLQRGVQCKGMKRHSCYFQCESFNVR